jgi:hypothetical protein
VGHVLQDTGFDPAARLLVDGVPRREVVVEETSLCTGANQPAEGIEDLAEGMLTLGGVLTHQGEVGGGELSLLVAHVTWVGFSCFTHTPILFASFELSA